MFRIISFLSTAIVAVAVSGFLLGWYTVQTTAVDADGLQETVVRVDRNKIRSDLGHLHSLVHRAIDGVRGSQQALAEETTPAPEMYH